MAKNKSGDLERPPNTLCLLIGWKSLSSYPELALLRWRRPNSIISARPTHPHALAKIISMMMSASRCCILPLSDLRKSGTERAKFINLFRILPLNSDLFTNFEVRLGAFTPVERTWSSGLFLFITNWFATIKLRKIGHLTNFYTTYFIENQGNECENHPFPFRLPPL